MRTPKTVRAHELPPHILGDMLKEKLEKFETARRGILAEVQRILNAEVDRIRMHVPTAKFCTGMGEDWMIDGQSGDPPIGRAFKFVTGDWIPHYSKSSSNPAGMEHVGFQNREFLHEKETEKINESWEGETVPEEDRQYLYLIKTCWTELANIGIICNFVDQELNSGLDDYPREP